MHLETSRRLVDNSAVFLTTIIIIIILLGSLHILTIPESPHWLVMKQRPTQALKSLVRLRGLQYDCVRERDYLGRGLMEVVEVATQNY